MFKVGQRVWFNYNKWFGKIQGKLPKIHGEQVYLVEFAETLKHQNISEQDLHQTADDMFEALGYEKKLEDSSYIIYESFSFEEGISTEVRIDKNNKRHKVSNYTRNNNIFSAYVVIEKHLAIHQKLIELGWL